MTIEVGFVEYDVQKLASRLGAPVTFDEATKILVWTETTIRTLKAEGKPVLVDMIVVSILRNRPNYDKEGKPYPHPEIPDSGDLCERCADFDKCRTNQRPCATPGHAMYCPPSMYEPLTMTPDHECERLRIQTLMDYASKNTRHSLVLFETCKVNAATIANVEGIVKRCTDQLKSDGRLHPQADFVVVSYPDAHDRLVIKFKPPLLKDT